VLGYDPKNPHWPARDRFILSKGHAAPLLYAVLEEAGYFSKDLLPSLRKLGSPLEAPCFPAPEAGQAAAGFGSGPLVVLLGPDL
jgi:transketolase N-terminal domain/subunit